MPKRQTNDLGRDPVGKLLIRLALPAITAQLTLCREHEAKKIEESSVRITGLISMPCAFGLAILAEPVTALLGFYEGDNLVLATKLMAVLAVAIAFDAVVLLTTAIMQAHGYARQSVNNMLLGGLLNLAAVYILTKNPHIGIVGTPIGILLGYMAISALNLFSMRRLLEEPPAVMKNLVRPFLASAVMGVFVLGVFLGLKALNIQSSLILCVLPIGVGVAVYAVAAVLFRVVTREDCLLLPKGEKIAKLLRL